jgi:hypothetical protein
MKNGEVPCITYEITQRTATVFGAGGSKSCNKSFMKNRILNPKVQHITVMTDRH